MFDEFRYGHGAGESDSEVDVVFYAADEEAIAFKIASDGGEISVQAWTQIGLDERMAVLGGEDDVDEDE